MTKNWIIAAVAFGQIFSTALAGLRDLNCADEVAYLAQPLTPEEVEEACFGRPLVQRAKSEGENPVYYVLGQTHAGRYLFAVVIGFPDGKGYPVTARTMTEKEGRRYRRWMER